MTLLQNIESGKLGTFIGSVRAEGKGLLHLVEDVETGFIQAFPSLEKYRQASQQIIDSVALAASEAEKVTASDPNYTQPVNLAEPAPAPPVVTGAPSGAGNGPVADLAGTGITSAPAAPAAPASDPTLPTNLAQ